MVKSFLVVVHAIAACNSCLPALPFANLLAERANQRVRYEAGDVNYPMYVGMYSSFQ